MIRRVTRAIEARYDGGSGLWLQLALSGDGVTESADGQRKATRVGRTERRRWNGRASDEKEVATGLRRF